MAPTSLTVPSGASTGRISVTTASNCGWTVVNSDQNLFWLKFDALQGTGSGTVNYTADANPTALSRTGTIQVAGKTISVTQSPTQCSYTLDIKSQNFPVEGGAGKFTLTTGCLWQPFSGNGNMITVPSSGTVRNTTGSVDYTVSRNSCVYMQSSYIGFTTTSVSGVPAFTVTQDGSPANMTLSPPSGDAGPAATDARVSVTTGSGCAWSATSSETWIQIINGSGSGNGSILYHLLANNTASRTGTIHIGALNYTITQASSGPAAPVISSVSSAASYRNDAVSPGEIVTLFGTNMGPATLVTLQLSGGSVTNLLAGTQVLFDGVPAPMIYTKNTQLSAVVPVGVSGKNTTSIQAVYNGQTSAAVTMPVQASHPGIFTLDSSGLGPGAILNQDNSVNASANPAARGSVVAIYATGGGLTSPALPDGAVTGADLPMITQTVSVTIGGVAAKVLYAGGAPGAVAGLIQINAEIPAGVTPGVLPVVVRVGNVDSIPGVTLVVR